MDSGLIEDKGAFFRMNKNKLVFKLKKIIGLKVLTFLKRLQKNANQVKWTLVNVLFFSNQP